MTRAELKKLIKGSTKRKYGSLIRISFKEFAEVILGEGDRSDFVRKSAYERFFLPASNEITKIVEEIEPDSIDLSIQVQKVPAAHIFIDYMFSLYCPVGGEVWLYGYKLQPLPDDKA